MKTPPIPARDVIVIGASTGGVEALRLLVAALPSGFSPAVLIVMHIGAHETILPSLLGRTSILPVKQARHGDLIEAGRIFVAPPDLHLTMARVGTECRVVLARTAKENYARPAVDPLFRSAAVSYGKRATGVILTGALDDGTAGLAAIKACGGVAVVQDPEEAVAPDMPLNAMRSVDIDHILRLQDIAAALVRITDANARGNAAAASAEDLPQWVQIENQFAMEGVDMSNLAELAKPSTFTCPECHGTLWELKDQRPRRYRCHTGHAFSGRSLASIQREQAEESIWYAIRALQEREMLLRGMADEAALNERADVAADYKIQAADAERNADVLRSLILQQKQDIA